MPIRPVRVSWLEPGIWELECTCGGVTRMSESRLNVECDCGLVWNKIHG